MAMKLMPSEKTVEVRVGDGNLTVTAFTTEDGKLVAPSQYRQPLRGPKCHGGHCAMCGAELEAMTRESQRGVCDDCAVSDPRWS
jgi:hypothetical protein